MSTVLSIRELDKKGLSIAEIARREGVSEPTVRKYVNMEDFSPERPLRRAQKPSILDPYKPIIDSYLMADRKVRRKQRHSAKRVYDRLVEEENYTGGYTTVCMYVKKRRAEIMDPQDGFMDLQWQPGEAQADFGEVDVEIDGFTVTMLYLVVSFPFSNVGFAQLFRGENAECVCQGLHNVFEFVGGAPTRIVFDNATGVGRRVCDGVRVTKTFKAFAAHYRVGFSFCNPHSGHEKGNVENKVKTIRANLFVPVPKFHDVHAYNADLLKRCLERAGATHYMRGEPCIQLFMEDAAALLPMPSKPFRAVRQTSVKTNKYGKAKLDGRHWYMVSPDLPETRVVAELGAFDVDFYDADGTHVVTRERVYGDRVTDGKDPASQLPLLRNRPGAWANSQVRASVPDALRDYVDGLDRYAKVKAIRGLHDVSRDYGYERAVAAAVQAITATGVMDAGTMALISARMEAGAVMYEQPADLGIYDAAIMGRG